MAVNGPAAWQGAVMKDVDGAYAGRAESGAFQRDAFRPECAVPNHDVRQRRLWSSDVDGKPARIP
jgi:hypothetical protein